MPSQALDLFRRRMLYLGGKIVEVQQGLSRLAQEERQLESRIGPRRASSLVNALSPALLGGSWEAFDRRWATQLGPTVRNMMSALVAVEQLAPVRVPEEELRQAQQLALQSQEYGRTAASLHRGWIDSPVGSYDAANVSLGQRYFRRYVTDNSPIITILATRLGTTTGGMVRTAAEGLESAGQALTATSRPAGIAETMQESIREGKEPAAPTGGNGLAAGVATVLLAGTGAVLLFAMLKRWLDRRKEDEEVEQ